MKKYLLLFVCSLSILGLKLTANPVIPEPIEVISELAFDENGKWMIEMDPRCAWFSESDSYTMKIVTTTGDAKVIKPIENNILTADLLDNPLVINQEGDSIMIGLYNKNNDLILNDGYDITTLCFGNHSRAKVKAPLSGQSLIYHPKAGTHVLCKTSNIGEDNDLATDFLYTTIRGRIYDTDFSLVKRMGFDVLHYVTSYYIVRSGGNAGRIYVDQEGEYEAQLFALKYENLYFKSGDVVYWYYELQENKLDLSSGEDVDIDFHITSAYVGIEDNNIENQLVRFFPNPVGDDRLINYEIDLPVNTMDSWLEVYSLNGDVLLKQKISENNGTLELKHIPKGTYILNLISNRKNVSSNKIILN